MASDNLFKQIEDILEQDRYYNGASVGEIESCANCGLYSLVCVFDCEDADTGVHTWIFRCGVCGYEDNEIW